MNHSKTADGNISQSTIRQCGWNSPGFRTFPRMGNTQMAHVSIPESTEVFTMKCRHVGLAAVVATMLMISSLAAQDDVLDDESYVAGDCCDSGCGCRGTAYGEVQFLYLGSFGTEDPWYGDDNNGLDAEGGVRLVTGYEGCNGLGIRFRWFDFDGTARRPDGDLEGLDLEYFDVEITENISICNLHGVVSAGYRHAEYDTYFDQSSPYTTFSGDGVTLGIQLERDICCNIGLFGWLQHSMLYGDDDKEGYPNTLMGWTEVQLGIQTTSGIGGYDAVIRTGVEAQRHEGMFQADTQDSGLIGWFVSGSLVF
jgi:hypothetical protein